MKSRREKTYQRIGRRAGYTLIYSSPAFLFLIISSLLLIGIAHAGTETLITVNTSGSDQQAPAIWGDWIVWHDVRDSKNDIYGYNVVSGEERRLSTSGKAYNPAISGNTVVWQDKRNSNQFDIYSYDLVSGTETRVTTESYEQSAPAIDGTSIVWQAKVGSYFDIIWYSMIDGTVTSLTPGTTNSNQKYPAISGDRVVWEDNRNGGSNLDIYMNDTASSASYLLTPLPLSKNQYAPSISGTRVVWRDMRSSSKGNVFMNDTSSWETTEVDTPPSTSPYEFRPAIYNDKVVWFDSRDRSSRYDLYLKNLTTMSVPEQRISSDASFPVTSPDTEPPSDSNGRILGAAIHNNRTVWTDKRSANFKRDIFLFTDDVTTTCPEADFVPSVQSGTTPLSVTFTDTSSNSAGITHRKWEFGDGRTSSSLNPDITYNSPGIYMARLTVGNSACRNETPVANKYNISVGIPSVFFTTNTTSGIVPLGIQANDTSTGATQWNWTFGDGSDFVRTTDPLQKNITHTYGTPGTYTLTLNASNSYGYAIATTSITALKGANVNSNPAIEGIGTSWGNGRQLLNLDTGRISNPHNTGTALICTHSQLADKGFQNITFLSDDGIGFNDEAGNIKGNISSVILQSKPITPTGFSSTIGEQSSVTFSLISPSYPDSGSINTQIWEEATTSDLTQFDYIASKSNYNSLAGIAYTIKITKTGFPAGTTAKLNVSVNTTWSNQIGEGHLYLIRLSDDGNTGEVLTAHHIATDDATGLSYFEIDSSRGASTFGLALLSGSGNPFQLITLTIASQVNAPQPSGGSESYGNSGAPAGSSKGLSAQAPQPAPEQRAPVAFIDPGKTAPLYANSVGVITQETMLTSTDTLASVVLGEGTIAKDSAGSPLSTVSIASIAADAIPAAPPSGQAVMIDGRSYELGPDGATFSPGITVTFTIPQAQWGKEYSLMMYDKATETWSEIPGSFNAKDGTFTAVLSHFCCVALFEKTISQPVVRQTTVAPQPEPARLAPVVTPSPQPPQNALSIVFSMAEWVAGEAANRSSYLTALAIICIIVLSIMLLHRRRNNP